MSSQEIIKKDDNKDDVVSRLGSVYEIAIRTREFEISQLIQRNNFFMLFQGVLLAAVFQNQASHLLSFG